MKIPFGNPLASKVGKRLKKLSILHQCQATDALAMA